MNRAGVFGVILMGVISCTAAHSQEVGLKVEAGQIGGGPAFISTCRVTDEPDEFRVGDILGAIQQVGSTELELFVIRDDSLRFFGWMHFDPDVYIEATAGARATARAGDVYRYFVMQPFTLAQDARAYLTSLVTNERLSACRIDYRSAQGYERHFEIER